MNVETNAVSPRKFQTNWNPFGEDARALHCCLENRIYNHLLHQPSLIVAGRFGGPETFSGCIAKATKLPEKYVARAVNKWPTKCTCFALHDLLTFTRVSSNFNMLYAVLLRAFLRKQSQHLSRESERERERERERGGGAENAFKIERWTSRKLWHGNIFG